MSQEKEVSVLSSALIVSHHDSNGMGGSCGMQRELPHFFDNMQQIIHTDFCLRFYWRAGNSVNKENGLCNIRKNSYEK